MISGMGWETYEVDQIEIEMRWLEEVVDDASTVYGKSNKEKRMSSYC